MAGIATYNPGLAGKITMLLSDSGESAGQVRAAYSWNIPATLSVEQVLYWDKRQDSLRHMFEPSLSDKGLAGSGCLWYIDRIVDLSQIRDSFLLSTKTCPLFNAMGLSVGTGLLKLRM